MHIWRDPTYLQPLLSQDDAHPVVVKSVVDFAIADEISTETAMVYFRYLVYLLQPVVATPQWVMKCRGDNHSEVTSALRASMLQSAFERIEEKMKMYNGVNLE